MGHRRRGVFHGLSNLPRGVRHLNHILGTLALGSDLAISTYLSIITLNVNGLNVPNKRHKVAEWIKNKTYFYAAYKRFTSELETHTA